MAGGQKTVISWQDAPDDLFYRAGAKTKKVRARAVAGDNSLIVSDSQAADRGCHPKGCKEAFPEVDVNIVDESLQVLLMNC